MKIITPKRFWYEFWKPRVIVINDCKHKWEEIDRITRVGWDQVCLKKIGLKCKKCGELKKMILRDW